MVISPKAINVLLSCSFALSFISCQCAAVAEVISPAAAIRDFRAKLYNRKPDGMVGWWDAIYFKDGKQVQDFPSFAFFADGTVYPSINQQDQLDPKIKGDWSKSIANSLVVRIGTAKTVFTEDNEDTWSFQATNGKFDRVVLSRRKVQPTLTFPEKLVEPDSVGLVGTWRFTFVVGELSQRVAELTIQPGLEVISAANRVSAQIVDSKTAFRVPNLFGRSYILQLDDKGNLLGICPESACPVWFTATCVDPSERWPLLPKNQPILLSGDYQFPSQTVIHRRAAGYSLADAVRIHCESLIVEDGVEFEGPASIWIWGTLNLEGKANHHIKFRQINLYCDLGGDVKAQFADFADIEFGKNGPWFLIPGPAYSGHWQFDRCSFTRGQLGHTGPYLGLSDIGVKFTQCFFDRCSFRKIEPRDKDYYNTCATDEWRTIKGCVFKKCSIPLSVAWTADKCDYYDASFLDDDPFTASKSISRDYFLSPASAQRPDESDNVGGTTPRVFFERSAKPLNPAVVAP